MDDLVPWTQINSLNRRFTEQSPNFSTFILCEYIWSMLRLRFRSDSKVRHQIFFVTNLEPSIDFFASVWVRASDWWFGKWNTSECIVLQSQGACFFKPLDWTIRRLSDCWRIIAGHTQRKQNR